MGNFIKFPYTICYTMPQNNNNVMRIINTSTYTLLQTYFKGEYVFILSPSDMALLWVTPLKKYLFYAYLE